MKEAYSEISQGRESALGLDRMLAVFPGRGGAGERLIRIAAAAGESGEECGDVSWAELRRDRLKGIREAFGVGRYRTISILVERMKVRIGRQESLRKRVDDLISAINMSQEQTQPLFDPLLQDPCPCSISKILL
jgi:hypothetical protein